MTTILHPKADRCKDKMHKNLKCFNGFHFTDYILVPHLDVIGSWSMRDMLPLEQQGMLAVFANELERK
jgi:hypothetical protein